PCRTCSVISLTDFTLLDFGFTSSVFALSDLFSHLTHGSRPRLLSPDHELSLFLLTLVPLSDLLCMTSACTTIFPEPPSLSGVYSVNTEVSSRLHPRLSTSFRSSFRNKRSLKELPDPLTLDFRSYPLTPSFWIAQVITISGNGFQRAQTHPLLRQFNGDARAGGSSNQDRFTVTRTSTEVRQNHYYLVHSSSFQRTVSWSCTWSLSFKPYVPGGTHANRKIQVVATGEAEEESLFLLWSFRLMDQMERDNQGDGDRLRILCGEDGTKWAETASHS
ncbi:hypothetical protein CRENBAI_009288, partial [Crenichthys baileyi]